VSLDLNLTSNTAQKSRVVELLMIEDSPADAKLAQKAIEQTGILCRIQVITDGDLAIKYIEKTEGSTQMETPDLILLDLNLPKLNGVDVLNAFKKSNKFVHTPVIVLSTSNADTDILKTYRLHANCYIQKPRDFNSWVETFKSLGDFWLKTAKLPPRLKLSDT
jgi:chemotaxis family two-component system response regulator Rcp1